MFLTRAAVGVLCLLISLACCTADLNMDAVIHFRTKYGDTLLHAAVKSHDAEALSSFLELGCPTEATDKERRTAMWLAVEEGEVDLIRVLHAYKANIFMRYGMLNETLIHAAAKNGRDLAIFWLLNNGFDTELRDAGGWTPLHAAAAFNYKNTVRLLLAGRAEIDAKDNHGETPLHKAVRLGRVKIARLLVDIGANVSSADDENRTPLFWAIKNNSTKLVELLKPKEQPEPTA